MLLDTIFASSLFVAGALAAAEPAPYKLGAVNKNNLFGVVRRQEATQTAGYQPTETSCGLGDTCAIACGAGFEQCASTDQSVRHCYNPTIGDICCPDLSGSKFLSVRRFETTS